MVPADIKPEEKKRITIDENFEATGWVIQNYKRVNLTILVFESTGKSRHAA